MRVAVFALTEAGLSLAGKILTADKEDSVDIFVSARLFSVLNEKKDNMHKFNRIKEGLEQAFSVYDALVCIMATGIVVRSLAPLLKSKTTDPAVVVFDERGKHGISLLSGHLGGANELTRRLCALVGADPVITTATDTEGKLAPDSIAERLHLRPYPKERILAVNRAILQGKQVIWQIDASLKMSIYYRRKLAEFGQQIVMSDVDLSKKKEKIVVVVTSQANLPNVAKGMLCMIPQRLIAGVGCRKSVSAELVEAALQQAVTSIGTVVERIDVLASTMHKSEEQGLIATAAKHKIPFHCFDNETMARIIMQYHLIQSDFVQKTLGIGNVCEAAAYAEAGEKGGRLALPKTKYEKVTVALLWEK